MKILNKLIFTFILIVSLKNIAIEENSKLKDKFISIKKYISNIPNSIRIFWNHNFKKNKFKSICMVTFTGGAVCIYFLRNKSKKNQINNLSDTKTNFDINKSSNNKEQAYNFGDMHIYQKYYKVISRF